MWLRGEDVDYGLVCFLLVSGFVAFPGGGVVCAGMRVEDSLICHMNVFGFLTVFLILVFYIAFLMMCLECIVKLNGWRGRKIIFLCGFVAIFSHCGLVLGADVYAVCGHCLGIYFFIELQ